MANSQLINRLNTLADLFAARNLQGFASDLRLAALELRPDTADYADDMEALFENTPDYLPVFESVPFN